MMWSQHRKRIKSFICPELQKRIDFHTTKYRKSHDHAGEAWITVDGEKVLGAGFYKWWKAFSHAREATDESSTKSGIVAIQHGAYMMFCKPEVEALLMEEEVYETSYFLKSTRDYLQMDLDSALESDNHFIRAFAMIDRRLGKRRYDRITLAENAPSIVKLFYLLRAEAFADSLD